MQTGKGSGSTNLDFMMKRWLVLAVCLGSGLLALSVQAQGPAAAPEAAKSAAGRSSAGPWTVNLDIDGTYAGYEPAFSRDGRAKSNSEELKYSRQKLYVNMADVQMDAQVKPILDKANDTAFEKKDYRKASELYRRIIQEYPDDLYQIAEEGVFVSAARYAQLRLLAFPPKELAYYRTLFDPAAKEIFERAVKRYSIFDYKELVKSHLATSYGDDALYALGNAALDNGQYDEARRCYEQLLEYHGLKDEDSDDIKLNRDQVWVRLAICYKYLGRDEAYKTAIAKVADRNDPATAGLMGQLEKFKYNEFEIRQREGKRSARYEAMDNRILSEPMPNQFSANRGEWQIPLAKVSYWQEPEALPWATDTDLIYKDMNVLTSRSLLTGQANWVFGPGGSSQDWDFSGYEWMNISTVFTPEQPVLVHDGAVFANMFVSGPSLVAIDQYTGLKLWARGPMAAQTEDEWLDRYQAAPAAGRGMIVVPVVHDDIRGRTHISSSADLAAFDSRTGKLLWRKTLTRISPLKITQSRYPRKIRILSSTPLLNEGVVYHCSNAGAIVAVDSQTGDIRWMTRYPQLNGVLDNFTPVPKAWRNTSPVVRGNKIYVTPVDCPFLMCLDKESGRILWTATQGADSNWGQHGKQRGYSQVWRLAGFSPDGQLILTGRDVVLLNPDTGTLVWAAQLHSSWMAPGPVQFGGNILAKGQTPPKGLTPAINGDGDDYWFPYGLIETQPTITRDGKMYFGMKNHNGNAGGVMLTELCLDMNPSDRKFIAQRRWFTPHGFIVDGGWTPPIVKRPVNEEPEEFLPAMRMAFTRWGVKFEVDVTKHRIVVRYDRKALDENLAKAGDLNTMFAKAEIARKKGDTRESIKIYEACKDMLPSEEDDVRRNLNLRLYPLYTELAQWGYESANLDMIESACRKMGATASNPSQEIQALLAYSELHEKRGAWDKSAQVLQNASRHYWREPATVSGLETGDRTELMKYAETSLANLLVNVPAPHALSVKDVGTGVKSMLGDYFLSVADVDSDYVLETRTLIAKRLRQMLMRAPDSFKKQYEELAAQDLAKYSGLTAGERLLWCWPQTEAGKKKTRELADGAGSMKPVEAQAALRRLDDLAEACGLGGDLVKGGRDGLERVPVVNTMESGAGMTQIEADNGDSDIVRLILPQKGLPRQTAHLMITGGRKKSSYGNKFTVTCHDMKSNKKVWETRELLLYGKTIGDEGFETGFEEVFIAGNLAIVHGRYDVIALAWDGEQDVKDGKKEKRWHFRVPVGFEIQKVDMCGNLLVLCGRGSTVALSCETGDIVWDAGEVGEFYAGPFFHKDMMLTVRNSPSEVSFRKVGSGRLLSRLRLTGLSTNRKHPLFLSEAGKQNPAASEAAEAYPVAFGEGLLAVVDGPRYYLVDVEKMQLRWSTPATKLDPAQDPAYRMWLDGGKLFVLKPYYSVLENAVFDTASGNLLWRRREGGKKADEKVKEVKDGAATEGAAKSTGLVLSSMVFINGTAYGIKYEMSSTAVILVGMDPVSGNETMRVEMKGYTEPEAYVEPSWSKDCVTVRIQDGNKFEVWQVDVQTKKIVQQLQLQGYGRLGEYGEASALWQGPYSGIWTYEKHKFTAPAK